MEKQQAPQPDSVHEGFVVWDQHGLVVRWADGASRRFSWEALRHLNGCPACQHQPFAAQSTAPQECVTSAVA
jgi:DUF971 family protein